MRLTIVAAGALVNLILLSWGHGVHSGIFNAGPYNLKLVRYENCEDPGTGEVEEVLRMTKRSTHKTFLHGHVNIPFDYDDSIQEHLNFSRRGAQGWGNNAYILKTVNYCSTFSGNYPLLFEFFFRSWGIEKPSCPIKAGNYSMDLDTDFPRLTKLAFLPYGTYRISHALLRGNPLVTFKCNVWYISCTERPR